MAKRVFGWLGQPMGIDYTPKYKLNEHESIGPYFMGYEFNAGVSTYRGVEVGEGGYVYAEPGMYGNVAVLDVASMHPRSIIEEELFGPKYTKIFEELVEARVAIKHKDFKTAKKMLGGKLAKHLDDEESAAGLSDALKIAINSVYGLTAASFDNPFRDPRNIDNIVAKRGALFMIDLQHAVQEKGFRVAHIKTDSIKIPDADAEIIKFVEGFGREYGYTFEHEATYDRFCLVNDAVFVAKYATVENCKKLYGAKYVNSSNDILKENKRHEGKWTATGTQFQVPYVFKRIFSKEEIVFDDLCETKAVTSALYLRFGEELRFVGRIGRFCPMLENGGELLRESVGKDGEKKYHAATGSKGYLWMESEMVKSLGLEDKIDRGYYDNMVDKAIKAVSETGNYEWFVSDDPYIPQESPSDLPPWD